MSKFTEPPLRVLLVEDEEHNRLAVFDVLTREGCDVVVAEDGRRALDILTHDAHFDLVLSDLRMPGLDGSELLRAFKNLQQKHSVRFAFMSAYGRLHEAVELLREGAVHYLEKPIKKRQIVELLVEVRERRVSRAAHLLQASAFADDLIVAESDAMKRFIEVLNKVLDLPISVHLFGESGSGKDFFARYLHQQSQRNKYKFICISLQSIPDALFEADIFGAVRGAYTGAERDRIGLFEAANQGTVYLDGVEALTPDKQVKLLRVLDRREVCPIGLEPVPENFRKVDVRIVSSSRQSLTELVATQTLREDFSFRLGTMSLEVPPLRLRKDDVLGLTQLFLNRHSMSGGNTPLVLSAPALEYLENYIVSDHRGGVRGLQNLLERVLIHREPSQNTIEVTDLAPHIHGLLVNSVDVRERKLEFVVGDSLDKIEDQVIAKTLEACNGDRALTAKVLGIGERTIYRWLDRQRSGVNPEL